MVPCNERHIKLFEKDTVTYKKLIKLDYKSMYCVPDHSEVIIEKLSSFKKENSCSVSVFKKNKNETIKKIYLAIYYSEINLNFKSKKIKKHKLKEYRKKYDVNSINEITIVFEKNELNEDVGLFIKMRKNLYFIILNIIICLLTVLIV